jgi:aminoglycoside phosphotransferase (APT) family kinase protein
LEDLDQQGYSRRAGWLGPGDVDACLAWLAAFHARFLGTSPEGLWEEGCYWHLETRPDEWALMPAGELKDRARELDRALAQARFRTLVHGDAKVANFCFSREEGAVAAVDFQYVGGGVGMKDVAYFFSSVFRDEECAQRAPELIDVYFGHLEFELTRLGTKVDFPSLEREWRSLYSVAWADFYRFLAGWAPGHQKMNSYSERMTREALAQVAPRIPQA